MCTVERYGVMSAIHNNYQVTKSEFKRASFSEFIFLVDIRQIILESFPDSKDVCFEQFYQVLQLVQHKYLVSSEIH
jgi:hypothetical protein